MTRRRSDAVRLAELDVLRSVLGSPIFQFVAGFIALESAQKAEITGNVETGLAEVALAGIAGAQAIAPLAPYLVTSNPGASTKLLAAATPLLLRG